MRGIRAQLKRKDVPSVNLALPPVGWHKMLEHEPHRTTVCACENTVVIAKHPGGGGRYEYRTTTIVQLLTETSERRRTGTFDIHEI